MKIVPQDNWGEGVTPRRWQSECQKKLESHYSLARPENAVVRAIMGSGKALQIAQLCKSCELEKNETIVVSTSSIYLVEDLLATIKQRFGTDGFFDVRQIGSYYTHGKDVDTPIIVTCMPSVPELAERLAIHGKKVALWICDECHRSEVASIKAAYEILTPQRVCGFTATPFRADKTESLTLFSKLLHDYGPGEALKDGGVIVPWDFRFYDGPEMSVDEAMYSMCKDAIGPGIINSLDVDDAEAYAKLLNDRNFPAVAVHYKVPLRDIKNYLKDLEEGRLRAVIHCNMLQEGANFPFIQWMGLRRPVSSRVRFGQEIGRGLRAHTLSNGEQKKCCVYYDPWNLFSLFSLDYEAVLGGEFDTPVKTPADEAKERERLLVQEVFEMMREVNSALADKKAVPVAPLAGYLTSLIHAFDVCHLIDRQISARRWRDERVTQKQLDSVDKMMCWTGKKIVPSIHQRALGVLAKHSNLMNKGMASDMITIQMALAEKGAKWPDFKNLDQAAVDGLDKHEKKRAIVRLPSMKPGVKPVPQKLQQGMLFDTKRSE